VLAGEWAMGVVERGRHELAARAPRP
jgi:hypothetical protein